MMREDTLTCSTPITKEVLYDLTNSLLPFIVSVPEAAISEYCNYTGRCNKFSQMFKNSFLIHPVKCAANSDEGCSPINWRPEFLGSTVRKPKSGSRRYQGAKISFG